MRWLLATILFFSLWYSTTAHYLVFPEPSTFMSLPEWDSRSSLYGDTAAYRAMVDDISSAEAPYRYRPLPSLLVRGIRAVTGIPALQSWLLMNMLAFMATGVMTTAYLSRYGFRWSSAILGGVMMVTLPAMQGTTMLELVDPLSLLLAIGMFWTARAQKPLLFILIGVLAIWTKEVFLFGSILWSVCYLFSPLWERASYLAARLWKSTMAMMSRRGNSRNMPVV